MTPALVSHGTIWPKIRSHALLVVEPAFRSCRSTGCSSRRSGRQRDLLDLAAAAQSDARELRLCPARPTYHPDDREHLPGRLADESGARARYSSARGLRLRTLAEPLAASLFGLLHGDMANPGAGRHGAGLSLLVTQMGLLDTLAALVIPHASSALRRHHHPLPDAPRLPDRPDEAAVIDARAMGASCRW